MRPKRPPPKRPAPGPPPRRIYQVQRVEQLSAALLVTRPEYIYLPLDQCAAHLDRCAALEQAGIRVGAVLPRILFDSQWPEALEQLEACKKAGITAAVCTNLGQAHLLEQVGMELRGDFGLNVMNSQCLKELKALGLQSATASFEMTFPQIRDLSKALELEAEECAAVARRYDQGTALPGKITRGLYYRGVQ